MFAPPTPTEHMTVLVTGDDGAVKVSARAEVIAGWHCSVCGPTPVSDRWNATVVWTGHEVILFGGQSGHKLGQIPVDGAAYEPASGQWRPIPPAPGQAGAQVAAGWTGAEAIFFGGYENTPPGEFKVTSAAVAYDPRRNTWRVLPVGPLSPRAGAVAVWTGVELVVAGGYPAVRTDTFGVFSDAAAYQPGADTWRVLPTLPDRACPEGADLAYWPLELVYAGDRLIAWRPWQISTTTHDPRGRSVSSRHDIDRFELTAGADRWALTVDQDPPRGVRWPIWTGSEVVVPATPPFRGSGSGPAQFGLRGARLDVGARRWQPIAAGGTGPAAWTGAALVSWTDGVSVWDPDSDTWAVCGAPVGRPDSDSVAVWTGGQVLLVNARQLYRLSP